MSDRLFHFLDAAFSWLWQTFGIQRKWAMCVLVAFYLGVDAFGETLRSVPSNPIMNALNALIFIAITYSDFVSDNRNVSKRNGDMVIKRTSPIGRFFSISIPSLIIGTTILLLLMKATTAYDDIMLINGFFLLIYYGSLVAVTPEEPREPVSRLVSQT